MNRPQTTSRRVDSPLGAAVLGAPKILVADDDAVIVHAISKALKWSGYAVTAVSDGCEAWEAINRESFDLILIDEQMPGLTGHGLILKARQHPFTFPIIVMSAQLDFFLDPRNSDLQVAKLLRKPFRLRELTDAVACILHSMPDLGPQPNSDLAQTANPLSECREEDHGPEEDRREPLESTS